MEDYLNLRIAQVNNSLDQIMRDVPVGIAYFLLKSKEKQFELLFNEQVSKEFQDYQATQAQESEETEKEGQN